jgi:peptidyl-prolyl cis-trans isomerase SurA
MQEARRLGITVEGAAIERAIATIASNNGLSVAQFLQALERADVSLSSLEEQIQATLAWREVVRQQIAPRARVSDAEVDDELRRIESARGQTEYLLAEIFLAVESPQEEAETAALANELVQQIRGGADFAAVAGQFSDNAARASGGDLGWVPAAGLAPELEAALANLSPGQLSNPVRTPTGYHILLLRDERQAAVANPGDTAVTLGRLLIPFSQQPTQALADRLSAEAREVTAGVNNCEGLRAIAQQYGTADVFGAGEGRLRDLPDPLRNLVEPLGVGAPSEPQVTQEGVLVFMVCDRQSAEAQFSAEGVRERLFNERVDLLQRRYLRDLRSAAFIDIRQ